MSLTLSRRAFAFGSAAFIAAAPSLVRAQGTTRTVTTSLGTYDIPASPQRVITIDSRLDLQPAMALGLPVVGYAHSVPGDWVPVPEGAAFFGGEVNLEHVLATDPDLVICADYNPDSVWWPLNKLREIAPVLPTNGDLPWKDNFRALATWLGMEGAGDGAIAEYDQFIADIRRKHGDKLTQKRVVSVQPDAGGLWPMTGTQMLHAAVLADLGANHVPAAEGQKYESDKVSSENFAAAFADVDGFLIATTGSEELDVLARDPLWQRLPAVAAGAVVASNGNVNYGSIYSARHLAGLFDQLYGRIA
jgi:iron complex transport system substrate-binding protein